MPDATVSIAQPSLIPSEPPDKRTKEWREWDAKRKGETIVSGPALMSPADFAAKFFTNNPMLVQLMGQQGQPNVESAAADLCVRAYRSYLLAASPTYFEHFKRAYPDVKYVPNPLHLMAEYQAALGS